MDIIYVKYRQNKNNIKKTQTPNIIKQGRGGGIQKS